jgi:hypothetical protein
MLRPIAFLATIALASCGPEVEAEIARQNALAAQCRAAANYGQMFGTPDDRGPCWGPLITVSEGYGMSYYHMRTILGGQAIVMYDGNRLVSVTLG